MKIIVEGPKGYPIDEANRVARLVKEALLNSEESTGTAIIGIDDDDDFVYAGPIWVIQSRIEE